MSGFCSAHKHHEPGCRQCEIEPMYDLKTMLKRHEGFSPTIYRCPSGYFTVGWGHKLGNDGLRISRVVADKILDEDIHQAEFQYLSLGWGLDRVRRDAIIHMIFWHGFGGFMKFKKTIAAIEREDWQAAHDELLDSDSGRRYTSRMTEIAETMRDGE